MLQSRNIILIFIFLLISHWNPAQNGLQKRDFKTYCNPIDIDYTYVAHNSYTGVSYRAGADPAVINFNGKYYMFVTRSYGYWVSEDMSNWEFVTPQNWYFNGSNAPAAAVHGDKVIVAGDPSGSMAVIETKTPEVGDWQTNYRVLPIAIQDPALFVDVNGRVYLYEESSNVHPLHGVELDPEKNYLPIGEEKPLITLDPEKHGWERFGQDHSSDMAPYLEGPWMTKHNGVYYLQYGAPGTEFNVYADGVYTSNDPLGPFEYAPYSPISYKPGGFVTGAGHGSTVQDNNGNYWHFATMPIAVNYKFERRIGLFPAGFEDDGQMYVNTAYGDYPHFLPGVEVEDHKDRFTGWMLLSYNKGVTANSVLPEGIQQEVIGPGMKAIKREANIEYDASKLVDENISTFWVANGNDSSMQVSLDLGKKMRVNAVQVNFQEFNADIFGRQSGLKHQFIIEHSPEGRNWKPLIDYSENMRDQPHAYIELETPTDTRYLRYKNVDTPNEYLAISEFRVFGKGYGKAPSQPKSFEVARQQDRRNARVSWKTEKDVVGSVIYWGIEKEKLNNSVMVYEKDNYELRALNADQAYYLQVENFNENGISERSKMIRIE
ncbi:family 43 glycosylhydrolase [Salinimicrobium sp. TH3]|uniref:family 43 glycosylhydrolase n=1 Tax=Salinimicrobium sp. TH3 TaxID=2997342 RepID=UPI002274A0B5|nr:family 43 glycosylhydrolase [Salinimicrobium sp. TH3]MCY2686073.1 family 43 glycosylhydrolase [Salinimicrobium sp. TH3]